MTTGLGLSEIVLVLLLVLVFLGSKEIPVVVREVAKFMANVRRYGDKLHRELNEVTQSLDTPLRESQSIVSEEKLKIRAQYLQARRSLDPDLRVSKSAEIWSHLETLPQFVAANSVLMYIDMASEVHTSSRIAQLLKGGKRVLVPHCCSDTRTLGIAEITDPDKDLIDGAHGIREPKVELRGNFFMSDVQLILCPAIAFDLSGGRLGRGKAYYDNFLRQFKGKVPIVGLAFECQIHPEPLPVDFHDIPVDQIVTENGVRISGSDLAGLSTSAVASSKPEHAA